ncbi:MAG TPA: FAD-dependent oxidoreductase, partial [Candidatus Bathyarchaeia archaeon]|nr:FAD-dependent oxidoreductase [Candidatus Bathyarchaeia archaeon]
PEYSRCGLPYAFSHIVPSLEALIGYDEAFYEQMNRIDLRLGHKVVKIDTARRTVETIKTRDQSRQTLEYDSLILTTGARASTIPVAGSDLKGVFTIRTMNDIEKLSEHLLRNQVKRAGIIGAGLTGSEMAEALLQRGIAVIEAEIIPEILPAILDPDMAAIVRTRAEEHGVEYQLNTTLQEIVGHNGTVSGIRVSGENYQVQAVIIAARVKPNTELAAAAGITLGEFGGIKTDEKMATSTPNVYAAGDCIETFDRITRRHVFIQLATTAVRQALVAGSNAAGGNTTYSGSTGVTTVKLFGLEVASFGPTTSVLEKLGIHPLSVRATGSTRLPYYPGGKDLTVKLLADPKNGRLIGAQLIGEEGATLRANFASMAGHLGLSVEEFEQIETCYSPPLAPVWDPVTIAAQALLRKLQTSKSTRPQQVPSVGT